MSLPDHFHPPLTAQEFVFAYPDEELAEHFFNGTLGPAYSGAPSLDLVSMYVLDHLYKSAGDLYERAVTAIFKPGIPVNVAVVATWLYIQQYNAVNVHPTSGYLPELGVCLLNRPLTLALTNKASIDADGGLRSDMDVESIGLFDCARRIVNQIRRIGMVVTPVVCVNHNLLQIYNGLRKKMELEG